MTDYISIKEEIMPSIWEAMVKVSNKLGQPASHSPNARKELQELVKTAADNIVANSAKGLLPPLAPAITATLEKISRQGVDAVPSAIIEDFVQKLFTIYYLDNTPKTSTKPTSEQAAEWFQGRRALEGGQLEKRPDFLDKYVL